MAHETDHHRALTQLLQSDVPMQSAPDEFEPDRMYRVLLSYTVPMADGHMLRPSDRVVVTGAFAETIRDAIISAVPVG